MSSINKEQKKKIKKKLLSNTEMLIAAIEQRMVERARVFEYENEKDTNKLNELHVQQEAITTLK